VSFRTDIETITGSISSYLTDASTHLTEGVKFITKLVMNNPEMKSRLTQSSTLNNSSPQLVMTDVLDIVSVTRLDANSGGQSRQCLEIPEYKAGKYADINSIYYTSALDPKYYISNNVLSVVPEPTASQTSTVKHITPDSSVAHGESSISNFPTELNRGVVLYASGQIIRKLLNVKNGTLVGLSLDNITAPSPANIDAVTVGSLGTAPTYSKPTTLADYTTLSATDSTSGTEANLGVDDWIADEDPEMATVTLDKQAQLVQNYSMDIQNELNEFQKELAIYQTDMQQKIEQAQISSQKEAMEIQNYQTEVESYSAQVVEAVQTYQMSVQEVVQDYNWLIQQYQIVQQDLAVFLQSYLPQQPMGEQDEITADDR
tara:strand:+ start:510 stop:1628 length:1119 start_codon:yes stop_codon:yes gene_type:complete